MIWSNLIWLINVYRISYVVADDVPHDIVTKGCMQMVERRGKRKKQVETTNQNQRRNESGGKSKFTTFEEIRYTRRESLAEVSIET